MRGLYTNISANTPLIRHFRGSEFQNEIVTIPSFYCNAKLIFYSGTDVIKASYETIHRTEKDDFKWRIKDPITVVNNTALISHEFIKLNLELKNGDTINEYLFQVVRKPEVTGRKQSKSELDLNMVIFAMDSLSHGHAQRKLPKTYAYIRDVLQGHAFMGHSAVGDGTTEQLAALLSGKGEREQPEARRNQPGAQVVDGWDWIFRRAKGTN